MNSSFARVTHGPVFGVCDAYWAKRQAADEKVNALAIEFGCVPGRLLRCGPLLEGLYLAAQSRLPAGWRAAGKAHPGFIKPNNRSLAGRAASAKLEAVKLPTDEDLAHDLGFPPFFTTFDGRRYCSSVGCCMRGGVYYLEYPVSLSRYLVKANCTVTPQDGVAFIKEWEYLKALDQE